MFAGSGEFMPDPDMALSVRKITAAASRKVALAAFRLAMTRQRRVTAVHKANVLKLSDGLFPVSYTHLDVYKRQAMSSSTDARSE